MNDFQFCPRLERTLGPLRPLQNQAIQFDGQTPGVQAEGLQEGQNGLAFRNLARLALEEDPHWI
jgi:hypothetical protein